MPDTLVVEPVAGEIWEHFKGQKYKILAIGVHSETQEKLVVYQPIGGGQVWVRPLSMWREIVKRDGTEKPRFLRFRFAPCTCRTELVTEGAHSYTKQDTRGCPIHGEQA